MTRRRWLQFLLLFALLLAGCGASPAQPAAPTTPPTSAAVAQATVSEADLRARPLHLPTLAAGVPCPRTGGRIVDNGYGPALGDGPVYPAGLGEGGVLPFDLTPDDRSDFAGSAWSGNKVLWLVAPEYRGPALIRGGRLDGLDELRFNHGREPTPTMWIGPADASTPAAWRDVPSYTRVRVPGCYAYQVDGDTWSRTIVFEAVPEDTSAALAPAATPSPLPAEPPATCPVTLPPAMPFAPPPPLATSSPGADEFWYGSDDLWTLLPTDGAWPDLPLNEQGYTQKVFWWREGYDWQSEPEPDLEVTGERLDAPAPPLVVSRATNGFHPDLQSFMLVGVDFPTAGCWALTGQSKGNNLRIVVWVVP